MGNFFQEYFVNPVIYPHTQVYNLYNTLLYAVILVIAVFLVYRLLKKLEIKIDKNFFIANLPYILLASVLRVLRDTDIYESHWLVSPLLYFTVFGLAFSILLITIGIERLRKVPYYIPMFFVGLSFLLAFSSQLRAEELNLAGFFGILGLTALVMVVIYGFGKGLHLKLLNPMNLFILGAAMFDACATFIGIQYFGYIEKHVVPNLFIGAFGPWVFIPIKFIVVLLALWAIDTSETDGFFQNFLKFAVLTITLGPGSRDALRLALGV